MSSGDFEGATGPSGARRRAPIRTLVRIAGVLIRAYPRRFRATFADDILAAFEDGLRAREHRGAGTVWLHALRSYASLLFSGLTDRVNPSLPEREPRGLDPEHLRSNRMTPRKLFEQMRRDLGFAVRALRRRPGFSIVAIITLALGIGANSAIYSLVHGVLLTPLEYDDADRLVRVWSADQETFGVRGFMSHLNTEDVGGTDAIESIVGFSSYSPTLTEIGEPRVLVGARVSSGILEVFGLEPFLGRDLLAEENVPNGPRSIVVSHDFWNAELGGSEDAVGGTVVLSDIAYQVVGVAPPGFDYPDGAEVWRPYYLSPTGCGRGCQVYTTIARLSPGASVERANQEITSVALALQQEFPSTNSDATFWTESLQESIVGDIRSGLFILMGSVALVLLIAAANVTNLLLVRASNRQSEIAVRAALGAGPLRLGWQIMTECFVLAAVGAALGILISLGGVALVRTLAADMVPRMDQVTVDGSVLLFTLLLAVAVTVMAGLTPAWRVAKMSLRKGIGAAASGGGVRESLTQRAILAGQIALSLVLLVGTGLLLKSFAGLYRVDLGYETDNISRFGVSLPSARYPTLNDISRFYEQLETRLAALPGVEATGSAFGPPLRGGQVWSNVRVEGQPPPTPAEEIPASYRPVTPGYFDTMRIPIVEGRAIEASDDSASVPVAVASREFVDQVFPNENPIGQRLRLPASMGWGSPTWTIVGVAENVRTGGPEEAPDAELYVPVAQWGPAGLTVSVRHRAGSAPTLAQLTDAVHGLDPNLPLRALETMEEAVAEVVAPTRVYLTLLIAFALLAVTLAAIGLYGVASYLIARRKSEIGLRVALGASDRKIMGLVFNHGLWPTVLGLVAGVGIAYGGARLAQSIFYEVTPGEPVVFFSVCALLLAVSLGATALPALRASRTDPVTVLRTE